MLVLQRKLNEEVILELGGQRIRVVFLGMKGELAKLGFHAPRFIRIDRREVWEERQPQSRDHKRG
jgi:carbon storage regulator CsrA